MKFSILLSLLALSSIDAHAQRLAVDMTCAQAQAIYMQNGLRRACPARHIDVAFWVRTKDSKNCLVGFRCYRSDRR